MTMKRLSSDTLNELSYIVKTPGYDRAALRPRLVHLGVGAFHRAHQAVYTEETNEREAGEWGTTGISLRSPTAASQLAPQNHLYTVGTMDGERISYRLISNMMRMITAPEAPEAALAALASPEVCAVTLTITEKGYALDPATGRLKTEDPDIAADLQTPEAPRSAIGYLAAALRIRYAASALPFTIISCDNLPSNGARVREAVLQYAGRIDRDFAAWIEREGAFPDTMVDRIVPATTPEDITETAEAIRLRDDAHVKAEPFRQWVIENKFAADRPQWEAAGAQIVEDVAAFETAKLRLLNGPHSAIAYLGYLSGYDYVHQVMDDVDLSPFITLLMDEEILPTVTPPAGVSLPSYTEALRERFLNSALRHRTWQIAMDGSQKLPQRLLDTIRDRQKMGLPYDRLALAVAAWIAYARGRTIHGEKIDVRDPLSARFAEIASASSGVDSLLQGFLSLGEVFGDDLSRDLGFAGTVLTQLQRLMTDGPQAAAGALS
ncbi:mannitol dehydrogenase family protein [Parvularcula marina]|uniref:mannitol dehydrogenase family protein n=1 Tax=Parvularcula marina TaxID=2292771 RepID=UPI00351669DA